MKGYVTKWMEWIKFSWKCLLINSPSFQWSANAIENAQKWDIWWLLSVHWIFTAYSLTIRTFILTIIHFIRIKFVLMIFLSILKINMVANGTRFHKICPKTCQGIKRGFDGNSSLVGSRVPTIPFLEIHCKTNLHLEESRSEIPTKGSKDFAKKSLVLLHSPIWRPKWRSETSSYS